MSGGSTVQHIDTVDAIARSLYLRAKQSGLPFSDVANAVRNLHLALRHLRTEAGDQDSLLNNPHASSSSLYARQLSPLVEDCDFTLAQLESLLDKYGDGRAAMPEEERRRDDRLAIMKSKLVNDKTSVEMFLDAVQLHAENRPTRVVDGSQEGFEGIKDKIDEIANKLFRNRSENSFTEDDDDLWREFKEELEKEGFSPQVLRKHKDVLRAYIRELESVQNQYGGNCPTVRGLLEQEAKYQPSSPKELDGNSYVDYPPVIVSGRRRSNSDTTRDHISSSPKDSDDNESDFSTALVSTQDIISMDSLNSRMASLNVQSGQQYSLSPGQGQRYLPSNSAGPLPDVPELSSSPTSYHFGTSPRSMPPMPPHMNGGPTYGSSPRSSAPRLAPDRWGNEIPPEAQWTKIRRTLVSPEVLERAGVRYEARPEYVAILGRLPREKIAEFARESARCRASRAMRDPRRHRHHDDHQDRRDSKSSREDDDSDSDLFDESDISDDDDDRASDKGTKSYPFIVNPPSRSKTSPSSTTLPKPILKNKNENHVRFDPEPHEVDGRSPRSLRDERDRERDHRRERRRHSPSRSSRRSRRHSDAGDRYSRSDRHGDYYDSNGRRYHRERDRKSSRRDERPQGRKKWGEALGAVGIGGAAVSLLSVLAEAAS